MPISKPCILIVDDHDDIRFALSLLLEQAGFRVVEAENPFACQQVLTRLTPDLILLDMNFSRDTTSGQEGLALLPELTALNIPVILMTAWANIELAVKGMQLGAKDFVEKPWRKDALLAQIARHIEPAKVQSDSASAWVAHSEKMQQIEQLVHQLAQTDANLLILGENGTGKSQLAQRIHQLSHRRQAPLINLNMAAITDNLFESELFGHQKGAFTDAKADRLGAFSQAQSGSLFMDEIGALPIHLQPKLLQVLETGQFTPLGASAPSKVDVRLIAATNQDIPQAIAKQQFRQDLYYRLNTFVITLPPLRTRQPDILPLAEYFIDKYSQKYNKTRPTLGQTASQRLLSHDWPGNVRELSHTLERAVLICQNESIDDTDLLIETIHSEQTSEVPAMTLEALEKQRILDVLAANESQISASAKVLGISRNALYRRLEKYQIDLPE